MTSPHAPSENACDGCGTNFPRIQAWDGLRDLAATVEIAPNVQVTVCGRQSRNNEYHNYSEGYAPKIGCLRKAWETRNVCPGCGEARGGGAVYIPVCATCADLLHRSKALFGEPPRRYSLSYDLLTAQYPDSSESRWGRDRTPAVLAQTLLTLIARTAAAKGPRQGPDDFNSSGGVVLPSNKRGINHGRVAVELDDNQRDAVLALGAAIKEFTDAMYLQGRRAGRDLLGGLVTGETSISEFEEKHAKWQTEED